MNCFYNYAFGFCNFYCLVRSDADDVQIQSLAIESPRKCLSKGIRSAQIAEPTFTPKYLGLTTGKCVRFCLP